LVSERRAPGEPARCPTFEGKADRWQIYEWFAPSFLRLHTGSSPAGTGAQDGRFVAETMQYRHCSVQTPETNSTTHYFFSHAANFNIDDPNVIDTVFNGVHQAFIEDKVIIEAQARSLELGDRFVPIAISHDTAMLKARSLIDAMLDQETAIP
jgi:hypothetical protein